NTGTRKPCEYCGSIDQRSASCTSVVQKLHKTAASRIPPMMTARTASGDRRGGAEKGTRTLLDATSIIENHTRRAAFEGGRSSSAGRRTGKREIRSQDGIIRAAV